MGWRFALVIIGVACAGCDVVTGLGDLEGRESRTAPPTDVMWQSRYGGTGRQRLSAMAVDVEGNIHLAGVFDGAINFGETEDDAIAAGPHNAIFVAKLAPDGRHLWSKAIHDATFLRVWDMAVSSKGDVSVVGQFGGTLELGDETLTSNGYDGFILQLGPTGDALWARAITGSDGQGARAVAVRDDFNIAVAGELVGDVVFVDPESSLTLPAANDAANGLWLAVYDRNGSFATGEVLGDSAAHCMAEGGLTSHDNDIIVGGSSTGTIDFSGSLRTSHGDTDAFVAKASAANEFQWSAMWGDSERNCWPCCPIQLAADAGGDVLMAISGTGTFDLGDGNIDELALFSDVLIAKLARFGDHGAPQVLWHRTFAADTWTQLSEDLAVDAAGNSYLVGVYDGAPDLGGGPIAQNTDLADDMFLVSFDPDGNHRFSRSIVISAANGDPNTDPRLRAFPRVATGAGGSVIVAGSFYGTLSGLGDALVSADGDADYDLFVAAIAPP